MEMSSQYVFGQLELPVQDLRLLERREEAGHPARQGRPRDRRGQRRRQGEEAGETFGGKIQIWNMRTYQFPAHVDM